MVDINVEQKVKIGDEATAEDDDDDYELTSEVRAGLVKNVLKDDCH